MRKMKTQPISKSCINTMARIAVVQRLPAVPSATKSIWKLIKHTTIQTKQAQIMPLRSFNPLKIPVNSRHPSPATRATTPTPSSKQIQWWCPPLRLPPNNHRPREKIQSRRKLVLLQLPIKITMRKMRNNRHKSKMIRMDIRNGKSLRKRLMKLQKEQIINLHPMVTKRTPK